MRLCGRWYLLKRTMTGLWLEPWIREEVFAVVRLLEEDGPQLGRPFADTLKGSAYANMKELRVTARRLAIRIAFAFDPKRNAVLLVAGDKRGVSETRFYKMLIAKADRLFARHLEQR